MTSTPVHRALIGALAAFVLLVGVLLTPPLTAHAAADPQPVVASSVVWSATSVNVTEASATVRVTVGMDPEQNLGSPAAAWLRSATSTQVSTGSASPTPGTPSNQRTFTFTLPRGAASGQWELDLDALYLDGVYRDVVPPEGAPTVVQVTSVGADLEAPLLHSLKITPDPVDITYGDKYVTVTASVTDRTDASVRVLVRDAEGGSSSLHLARIGESDEFANQFVVWTGSRPGQWSVAIEFMEDALGNRVDGPPLPEGVAGTFTVVSPPSPPGQPRVTYLAAWARGSLTAAWEAPLSDGGSPVTGYEATLLPSGRVLKTDVGTTTVTFSGLGDSSEQRLRVSAVNALGTGTFAEYGPTVTWGPPLAPPAPTAVARRSVIDVTWTAPPPSASGPVLSYVVTASPSGATRTVRPDPTKAQWSARFTELGAERDHTFTVVAVNEVGSGPVSASSAPVRLTPQPRAPVLTGTVTSTGDASLGWTVPLGYDKIDFYSVCRLGPDALTTIECSATVRTTLTMTNHRAGRTYGYAVTAHGELGDGPRSNTVLLTTPPGHGQGYTPLNPKRILDTRYGTGAPKRQVRSRETITLQIPSLAAGTRSVTMNLTATGATASTHLIVYAAGTPRPTASNLNVAPGQTVASLVTVPVSPDGRVSIYNHSGSVHLIADLGGYTTPIGGSVLRPMAGQRIVDTRSSTSSPVGKVGPGGTFYFGPGRIDGYTGPTAAIVNITATGATAATHLTAYPGDSGLPTASNLNVKAGETVANLAVVRLDETGYAKLTNSSGYTHVVIDLVGIYSLDTGVGFVSAAPTRVMDTRVGLGSAHPVGSTPVSLKLTDVPAGARAVTLRTTVVGPSRAGNLLVHPSTTTTKSSTLNFVANQTVGNSTVVPIGPDGVVRFSASTGVQTQLVVDLVGYHMR